MYIFYIMYIYIYILSQFLWFFITRYGFFQGVRVDTLDIPQKMIINGGCSVMGTSYLYIAANVGF